MPIHFTPWSDAELEILHSDPTLPNAQMAKLLQANGFNRNFQQVNDRRSYERKAKEPRDTLYEQRRKLKLRAARVEAALAREYQRSGKAKSWTEALYLVEQVAIGARE